MTHPNEKLFHTYTEAVENGDLATLGEVFADDVVGHVAGEHRLSGDYRGKDAVFGFFAELADRSNGTARLKPREVLVDDWFVIAQVDASGQVGATVFESEPAVLVMRVADGRFVEWWSHHYDQQQMDRVWTAAG